MRWLRDLFGSPQLRDCRFALHTLGEHFDTEWAWPDIRASVERSLRKEEKAVGQRMVLGGETAAEVVEDMVAITCLDEIETGRHHVYRGVRGDAGQSRRNIFASVVTEQLRSGRITVQEAAVAGTNMDRAVGNAG